MTNLFKKIYSINKEKSSEVIKVKNKYFIAEIKDIIETNKGPMNDKDVLKMLLKCPNKL